MTEEESVLRRLDDQLMEEFRGRLNRQDEHIHANYEVLGEIRDTLSRHGEILRMQGMMLAEQGKILSAQAETLKVHMAKEEEIKPSLDELISLWKGSRIIIPMFVVIAGAIGSAIIWFKDHISFK